VARHAECTGKDRLVRTCIKEIDERQRLGLVTDEERERLIGVLTGESRRLAETVVP
jgi:hypothetical protein